MMYLVLSSWIRRPIAGPLVISMYGISILSQQAKVEYRPTTDACWSSGSKIPFRSLFREGNFGPETPRTSNFHNLYCDLLAILWKLKGQFVANCRTAPVRIEPNSSRGDTKD